MFGNGATVWQLSWIPGKVSMQIASYCILKCYPIRCIPDFTWSKGNVFRFDQFEFILPQVGMQCMFNGREVHLRRPCVAYKLRYKSTPFQCYSICTARKCIFMIKTGLHLVRFTEYVKIAVQSPYEILTVIWWVNHRAKQFTYLQYIFNLHRFNRSLLHSVIYWNRQIN